MIKKTITYTDYNGLERKEDHYFNLSKGELMEMEMSVTGGLAEYYNRIVQAQDGTTLFKVFKELILKSFGVKSEDGKRFIKSEELSTAFSQTEAYSELLEELVTNTESATAFFNGIIPKNVKAAAE